MAWAYLIIAGLFEVGWPLGFKLSQGSGHRLPYLALAVLSMAASGYFLWLAQRDIPIGTAYAVWTAIGAAGTFALGILFFGEPLRLLRLVSFALILVGVLGLKISQ